MLITSKMLMPLHGRVAKCIGEIRWQQIKLRRDITGDIQKALDAPADQVKEMLIKKDKDYLIQMNLCFARLYQNERV